MPESSREKPKMLTVQQDQRAGLTQESRGCQEGAGRSSEPSEHLENHLGYNWTDLIGFVEKT